MWLTRVHFNSLISSVLERILENTTYIFFSIFIIAYTLKINKWYDVYG